MAVEVNYVSQINVVETLETNVPAALATNRKVTHNQFNTSATLNAGTTPPATKTAHFTLTGDDTTLSIDLRSLLGTNGVVVDGNGLKVQAIKFKAPSTNGDLVSVNAGGTGNEYDLLGDGGGISFTAYLRPGDEVQIYCPDTQPDIANGEQEIPVYFGPAGGDKTLQVSVVLG